MERLAATALAVLAVGASSASGATPAVPAFEQQQIKALLTQVGFADLAFAPTRLPPHFGFESYSVGGSPAGLNVTFLDQRFAATPAQAHAHEFSLDVGYLAHGTSCNAGAKTTARIVGVTVYSNAARAWRCFATGHGRIARAVVSGNATRAALAAVVASVRKLP